MPPRRHVGRLHSECRVFDAPSAARRPRLTGKAPQPRRASRLHAPRRVRRLRIGFGHPQAARPRALPSARTPHRPCSATSYSSTGSDSFFQGRHRAPAFAGELLLTSRSPGTCPWSAASSTVRPASRALSSRSGNDSMLSTVHACRCCVSPLSDESIALITIATTRCVESPTRLSASVDAEPSFVCPSARRRSFGCSWRLKELRHLAMVHPPVWVFAGGQRRSRRHRLPGKERGAAHLVVVGRFASITG